MNASPKYFEGVYPYGEFVLQPPASVRENITLDNLENDFATIVEKISAQERKIVSISKITNSRGSQIWNAVPLLPQLEDDAKILLTLASGQSAPTDAGLAP